MYEQTRAMFLYCASPLHVGAGTSLGAVDNPIQREVHTGYPMVPGSGLKGALRHLAVARLVAEGRTIDEAKKDPRILAVFGPETDSELHSGAATFSDARLVLFPVRSAKQGFVYATCPNLIGGLARLVRQAGIGGSEDWGAVEDLEGRCGAASDEVCTEGRVVLELYEFGKDEGASKAAAVLGNWLAEHALPGGVGDLFRGKVRRHLVVLPNDAFGYFMRNATVVEPHVRIDDVTGAADDGGLFYTECLPAESLLVSLVATSGERSRRREGEKLGAGQIMDWLCQDAGLGLSDGVVQVGGDATVGRGQVMVRVAGLAGKEGA